MLLMITVMMTCQGKGGGENVIEVNMNIAGMSTLFPMEFFAFWQEKYFHYSTFDDVIRLCH